MPRALVWMAPIVILTIAVTLNQSAKMLPRNLWLVFFCYLAFQFQWLADYSIAVLVSLLALWLLLPLLEDPVMSSRAGELVLWQKPQK